MRAAIEEANATPDADTINFNIGGTGNLGNTSSGVLVSFEGANNTIGSNGAARNTIAFNGQDGVEISGAGVTGNSILRNSIFSNAGLVHLQDRFRVVSYSKVHENSSRVFGCPHNEHLSIPREVA